MELLAAAGARLRARKGPLANGRLGLQPIFQVAAVFPSPLFIELIRDPRDLGGVRGPCWLRPKAQPGVHRSPLHHNPPGNLVPVPDPCVTPNCAAAIASMISINCRSTMWGPAVAHCRCAAIARSLSDST